MDDPILATDRDAEAAGRLIAAAFEDDPVMSWIFPAPDTRAKLDAMFGFLARESYVPAGATYLAGDACAVWEPPGHGPWPSERGERFLATLAPLCTGDDLRRLGALSQVTAAVRPRAPHWYLSVLAVWPERRGQGQGGRLLAETLRLADDAGLPAYLESTNPRNVSLYERHGFVATGVHQLLDGPSFTAMWREPGA
jgi:GNAT superfamily N-acetyltransferase